MKLKALAAVLVLLPVSAIASLGTAPTDPAPASTPDGAVEQAKTKLYDEIEGWRGTKLPHTVPPAPLTLKFEPRLNEIKADVRVARTAEDLAKPKKDLAAWEHELVEAKFAQDRKRGLAHGGINAFSQEQRQQAAFSAALRAAVAQASAEGSVAGAARRTTAGMRDSRALFDGGRAGSGVDDGAVSAGAPLDVNDPARYAKVRQILRSQGVSVRIVDMAIAEAIRQHADPLLVLAVINQESGFQTTATSYERDRNGHFILDRNGHKIPLARGLMQLLPGTAGVRDASVLYDARTNLRMGISYLKSLWGQFVGGSMTAIRSINPWTSHNVKAAVAAYNAGPGAVQSYHGVPPYRETQGYVRSVLGYYERFKQYLNA